MTEFAFNAPPAMSGSSLWSIYSIPIYTMMVGAAVSEKPTFHDAAFSRY